MVHQALLSIKRSRKLWFSIKWAVFFIFIPYFIIKLAYGLICACAVGMATTIKWSTNEGFLLWHFRDRSTVCFYSKRCVRRHSLLLSLTVHCQKVHFAQLYHCSAIDLLLSTCLPCWWQPGIAQHDFEMDSVWKNMSDPFRQTHSFLGASRVYKAPSLFFPLCLYLRDIFIFACCIVRNKLSKDHCFQSGLAMGTGRMSLHLQLWAFEPWP